MFWRLLLSTAPAYLETGSTSRGRPGGGMMRRPLSWLLTPFHVAALATGAKSFRDNPVIGSPTLNRAGLHIARVRLATAMAEWRRGRLAELIPENDRKAFERDGFILKPNFLPES